MEKDYFQELARSAFADMLHDKERNIKYSLAIKEAIDYMKSQGNDANVLDIGTGTGLLAMLAAKHKADSVVTIETFSPVTVFARKIIEQNGFKDKIKLINKHSTEVRVGSNEEMNQRANILVAEVFDTELIGEGAIKTYNSAHSCLLEDECIAVPHKANVYVQLVKSELASTWFKFKNFKVDGRRTIKAPEEVNKCRGLSSIHDIQLSQFPMNAFTPLADPIKISEFNFSSSKAIPSDESYSCTFESSEDIDSVILFLWWDLHMNVSGSITLSCAPHWAHPDGVLSGNEVDRRKTVPWRDHWMQGCYYIPKQLNKGEKYHLAAAHDEFSWFFDVQKESIETKVERPICTCCFHLANSRNQIMQINNEYKRTSFMNILKNTGLKRVLFVGDHSIIPLIAECVSNYENLTVYQEDELSAKSIKKFIEVNKCHAINLINDLTQSPLDISHLIADPYFNASILPIDNIVHVLRIIRDLCKLNQHSFHVHPLRARVCAVPVHFINLHKIRWPLESSCEGFNHDCFDNVVELASTIADDNVEPFSLWEYPCCALGKRSNVYEVDFNANRISKISPTQLKSTIKVNNFSMSCNGIAFWLEWVLDEHDNVLTSGPLGHIVSGELINWKFDRQAVHLIPYKVITRGMLSSIDVSLNLKEEVTFDFTYLYEK